MKYLIQTIGIVAFILFVYSLKKKDKKEILFYQLLANILYAIQYISLGAYIAGILNVVTVTRCFIYYKYEKDKKEIPLFILITYILIIILVSIFTVDSYISILPSIINIIYIVSTWQKNTKVLRLSFMVAAILWIYYNLTVGAYTAIIGNIFEIISVLYACIKLNRKNNIKTS